MRDREKAFPPIPCVRLTPDEFDRIDTGVINRFHADDRFDWFMRHWPSVVSTVWYNDAELSLARAVIFAAKSLMSEDGAKEALSHYNCLFILADRLAAYDAMKKENE